MSKTEQWGLKTQIEEILRDQFVDRAKPEDKQYDNWGVRARTLELYDLFQAQRQKDKEAVIEAVNNILAINLQFLSEKNIEDETYREGIVTGLKSALEAINKVYDSEENEELKEIPMFKGTLEQLDGLTIRPEAADSKEKDE